MTHSVSANPIMLKRIVVDLDTGERIGEITGGLLCVPHGKFTWKGGSTDISDGDFTKAFFQELQEAGYPVVGDPTSLFPDPAEDQVRFHVGGRIIELQANVCYPHVGDRAAALGGSYMRVNWQIFSTAERRVVYETTTEGSHEIKEPVSGGSRIAMTTAFKMAARNLMADPGFHRLVSGS